MINSKDLLPLTQELTLLFAEDHSELRLSTSEVLKNFFKEVVSVENGALALEEYKQRKSQNRTFDIVLTDIQMPKLNGLDLIEKIYAINHMQKIIVLSAYDDSNYLLPLINLGIAQFIKKPIDFQELLQVFLNVAKEKEAIGKNESTNTTIYLDTHSYFKRDTLTLIQKNTPLYLTKYEILLLKILTANTSKIFTMEEIVHGFKEMNEDIDSQNIRKLVSKLRKKLPKNSIESIYGVGYRILTLHS